MVIPKRSRTQTRFDKIEVEAGTTSKVPFLLTLGTLKSVPVSGGFEYDGTRYYGTNQNSVRKTFAFTDDIANFPKTIFYTGRTSNNIGISQVNSKGYAGVLPRGDINGFSGQLFGNKTASDTYVLFTSPYTTNSEVNKYFVFTDAFYSSQIVQVKSNTANTLVFYDDIIVSNSGLSLYPLSTSNTSNWFLCDKYIDTGFTGNYFKDAIFDGVNIWLAPQDTESNIYKINIFTKEVSVIAHPRNPTDINSMIFDGKFLWCFCSGVDHFKINTDNNSITSITNQNSLTNPFGIYTGSRIYVFGNSGNFIYYNAYLTNNNIIVESNVFSNTSNKIVQDTFFFSISNKLFLVTRNTSTNILSVDYFDLDGSGNLTVDVFTTTNISQYMSGWFDGLNISFFIKTTLNALSICDFNTLSNQGTRYDVTGPSYFNTDFLWGNAIFTGESVIYTISNNFYPYMDTNFFNPLTSNANTGKYINQKTYQSKPYKSMKLLCAGDLILQWGGRYIVKDLLPKSDQKNYGSSKTSFFIEKGINHNYKENFSTNNYEVSIKDYGFYLNTSISSFSLKLPDATKCKNQEFNFIDDTGNAGANNVTLVPSGSQTINGLSTYVINQNYQSTILVSNGYNWRVKK